MQTDWKEVRESVWGLLRYHIEEQIRDQVNDQVGYRVSVQIWSQLRDQTLINVRSLLGEVPLRS